MDIRIGHGYDVHALEAGLKLVIGGVEIKHFKGVVAHSDGDVVIHALCDAMLGALALGDIGLHFPDNNEEYKDIDSLILLKKTVGLVTDRGWQLVNADMTIVMQRPRLRPYIDRMRKTIAGHIGVATDQISIKATTEEHLGFTGREEGVAAHVVVLLSRTQS